MIDPRARILLFFLGLAVLALVVNLVRKRQLQERYALLWLLAGLVLVLAPLFVDLLDRLAAWLGFEYPPALLLMLAVVGLMLIIAQLSMAISNQADRIKILTQELGLLFIMRQLIFSNTQGLFYKIAIEYSTVINLNGMLGLTIQRHSQGIVTYNSYRRETNIDRATKLVRIRK